MRAKIDYSHGKCRLLTRARLDANSNAGTGTRYYFAARVETIAHTDLSDATIDSLRTEDVQPVGVYESNS